MPPAVKTRRYDNSRRTEAAARTRNQVIAAARRVFLESGYEATTLRAVAEAADVSLSTLKAQFANKSGLLSAVRDAAIAGDADPIRLGERDWFLAILKESDPVAKLGAYAESIATIHSRVGEIHRLVRDAAATDRAMADLWRLEHEQRRADVKPVASSLEALGALRQDVDVETATNTLWVLSSPENYWLLTDMAGQSLQTYTSWLHQAMLHTACEQAHRSILDR